MEIILNNADHKNPERAVCERVAFSFYNPLDVKEKRQTLDLMVGKWPKTKLFNRYALNLIHKVEFDEVALQSLGKKEETFIVYIWLFWRPKYGKSTLTQEFYEMKPDGPERLILPYEVKSFMNVAKTILTPAEFKVYKFNSDFFAQHKHGPSYNEIAVGTKIKYSAVGGHLEQIYALRDQLESRKEQ